MQKKQNKLLVATLCAVIAIIFALTTPLSVRAETQNSLDYSRPGSTSVTITDRDFFEVYLNSAVTDNEYAYWQKYGYGFDVKYSDAIATSYINAQYDENAQTVSLSAQQYSYQAANGQTVTWIPYAVEDKIIAGNATVDVSNYSTDYVRVTYQTSLVINKAIVNNFINRYYDATKIAYDHITEKTNEYDAAYAQYLLAQAEYDQYLADVDKYNSDLIAYKQYLVDLDEWKQRDQAYKEYQDAYNDYLEAKKLYEEECQAYEVWYAKEEANYQQEYQQYLKDSQRYEEYRVAKDKYDAEYQDYLQKINDPLLQKATSHLNILKYMYVIAGDNRTIRNAIMGGSVDTVISHKSDLVAATTLTGESQNVAKLLDLAEAATHNLRAMITEYEKLSTDEGKYIFYIANYSELKQNFIDLLRALDYLYSTESLFIVKDQIDRMGKTEQFQILLAQLYYICNALDNEKIYNAAILVNKPGNFKYFDNTYTIDKKSPQSYLGSSIIEDTNDAEPIEGGLPSIPNEPIEPDVVGKPTEPTKPAYNPPSNPPKEPKRVDEPGEKPVTVDKPTEPPEVKKPKAPTKYIPTVEEQALHDDYGNTPHRQPLEQDCVVELTTDVNKFFRNCEEITVKFYYSFDDYDFETGVDNPLYQTTGERGSHIEFASDIPLPQVTKDNHSDESHRYNFDFEHYDYIFDKWVYVNVATDKVTAIDWNNPPQGDTVRVFASYRGIAKFYPVVWVIDGVTYRQQTAYQDVPSYVGDTPQKENDVNGRMYRFDHWENADGQRPEDTVMSDVEMRFTAIFEASSIVTWRGENTFTTVAVWNGEIPTIPDYTPIKSNVGERKYRFTNWSGDADGDGIIDGPITQDTTYVAQFEASILINWRVNSVSTVTSWWAGEIPYYPYSQPTKPTDGVYVYTFSGWDKQIVPAQEDITYTAQFSKEHIFAINGNPVAVVEIDGYYVVDCSYAPDQFDISALILYAQDNDMGVTVIRANHSISFSASEVGNLANEHISTYSFSATQIGYREYRYTLRLFDAQGQQITLPCTARITTYSQISPNNSQLYMIKGEERTLVRYNSEDGKITFSVNTAYSYEMITIFNVYVAVSSISVTVDKQSAKPTEWISVEHEEIPIGMTLEKLYALDSSGNEIAITGGMFKMPQSDVTVYVQLAYIEYTIVFKADGKVISSKNYHYGDTVTPPETASKAPDGLFSYEFYGWDKEIVTVTGDAEYNAIFKATPLPAPVNPGLSKTVKLLIAGSVVGVVLVVAAITLTVVLTVRKKRKTCTDTNSASTQSDAEKLMDN